MTTDLQSADVPDPGLLLRGQVDEAAGRAEERLEDLHSDGRVFFGRGHEDRPVAHGGKAEVARVVPVAVEEEPIETSPGGGDRPLLRRMQDAREAESWAPSHEHTYSFDRRS